VISLEKEIPSFHFHPSVCFIDLPVPFIRKLIRLNLHRPFPFLHLHIGDLSIGDRGMKEGEEDG
jgi:hypothetical protein